MDFGDNAGLLIPIDAMAPIVARWEIPGVYTRADIWAQSALVAADQLQNRLSFSFGNIGRQNCEDVNPICRNAAGTTVPCDATHGPHRDLPPHHLNHEPALGTNGMYDFFQTEFGFGTQEVVALMGAHTLGKLASEHSCIDGPDGWVAGQLIGGRNGGGPHSLDVEYYKELIGGASPGVSTQVMIQQAPPWTRRRERNDGNPNCNDQFIWAAFPRANQRNRNIVMLNSDVALIRQIDTEDMFPERDGRIRCSFQGANACGPSRGMRQAAIYKHDEMMWLRDFRDVLNKMLEHGYRPDTRQCHTSSGGSRICRMVATR